MACMASSAASHYEVLGLDAQSSDDEIKTAFRQAAKRLHPDVNKEASSAWAWPTWDAMQWSQG